MISVSILIPVHNRVKITLEGLSALFNSIEPNENLVSHEVIVIDDGSTDGTETEVKRLFPQVHLLKGDGNLWWSGGINMGAKYAIEELNTDYVLLWNDDVIPSDNYFNVLTDYIYKNHPLNAIVGSKIGFYNDPGRIWSAGGIFSSFTGNKYTIRKLPNPGISIITCQWQPGMGTLVPRYVMKEENLYWDDKRYPQYYGDSDYTIRCYKRGIPIITNLDLVLYNRTELTGDNEAQDLKAYWKSLFSFRSFYELKRNLMFYTQHGIVPFAYYGMLKKYLYYSAGVIKTIFFK